MRAYRRIFALTAGIAATLVVPSAAAPPSASAWEIGPVIRGRNYTIGMPLQPTPLRSGWFFDFPNPTAAAGHVHYLTYPHGSLQGKRRIILRYRIDAARGVRFVPQEDQNLPATLSLFFQRRGDNWSGGGLFGRYSTYRWYSPHEKMKTIAVGNYEMAINLDDPDWIGVNGELASTKPERFADAKWKAERVGFVLGSQRARGHGVFSTGPARFTLLDFRVE